MIGIVGIFGAVLGSCLAVSGLQVPRGKSMVGPGFRCEGCGRARSWYELVPVLSWIALGGRCRTCRTAIPVWIPLLEGGVGTALALAWARFHWGPGFWLGAWIVAIMALLAAIDVCVERLPNGLVLLGALGTMAARIWYRPLPWWHYVAGAALGIGITALLRIVSRGGMGLGDVKLFGWVGLALGAVGMLMTLVGASLLGALYGLGLAAKKKLRADRRIPFGPWIAVAMTVVYLYGSAIRTHGVF